MWPFARSVLVLAALSSPPTSPPPPPLGDVYPNEEALIRYARGRLLEESGDDTQALGEYFRGLILDDTSPTFPRRVSELSARLGDANRALEFAKRAVALDSTDARGQWLQGISLMNLGRDVEALRALQAAVRADSNVAEYHRSLARAAERLDRVSLVAEAYRRTVELEPEDAESWFQLAAAEARIGRFERAEQSLAEASRLNPIRPGLFFLDGWIQESLGRPEKAVDLYRQHLDIHKDDQTTRRRLANLLARLERWPQAYQEAQALARARPDDLEARSIEIDLAFRSGHGRDAETLIERWREEAPNDPNVNSLALALMARNDKQARAAREVEAWRDRQPEELQRWIVASRIHQVAGRPAQALEDLEHAVAMAPDSLQPRVLLARLHQEQDHPRQAEAVWVETSRRFPKQIGVRLDLALCRERLDDLPGAEAAARDALALDPHNPQTLNFLGYMLADHNRKVDEAVDLVRRALEADPDNGAYLDSLGWAYYRLGRLAEARTLLERAVIRTGGDSVVHEHLGDVYNDMRLFDLAKDQYRLALSADESNARLKTKLGEMR